MGERFLSRGHVCSYCQGNGYHWQENCYRERYKQGCPVCKGSGRLDAVVTIEWKAGGR
nr:MAG TPA: DnaJ-like protein [Caudoviricetes sp.]